MGIFWDLMQTFDIAEQDERASSLEDRVARLETELEQTRTVVHAMLERLEQVVGEDLDQDGNIGRSPSTGS